MIWMIDHRFSPVNAAKFMWSSCQAVSKTAEVKIDATLISSEWAQSTLLLLLDPKYISMYDQHNTKSISEFYCSIFRVICSNKCCSLGVGIDALLYLLYCLNITLHKGFIMRGLKICISRADH